MNIYEAIKSDDIIEVNFDDQKKIHYILNQGKFRREITYKNPFILELELTRRCNLKCIHCYVNAEDFYNTGELSFAQVDSVLKEACAIGINELSLTGGEVLIRNDFWNIVDKGHEYGFGIRFVTNGTLIEEKNNLDEIIKRPWLKLITVSLDGINEQTHDLIRGNGSYRRTVDSIKKLVDNKIPLSVITAFSRININEFDDLFEFCQNYKIDWQVQIVSTKGRASENIILSPQQYYELGKKAAFLYKQTWDTSWKGSKIIPMDDLATYSRDTDLNILFSSWQLGCTGGLLNIFVRSNGDITPCSALADDEFVVGNVKSDGLKNVCDQERCKEALKWYKVESLTGICQQCSVKKFCGGGCPDILVHCCKYRHENQYCYYNIESQNIIAAITND